ncbi:MAG: C40 family peptidase [Deltaproteobacteria bacterium]|nr:C40 family peptidase [Deltaproteobacteria bacterium]
MMTGALARQFLGILLAFAWLAAGCTKTPPPAKLPIAGTPAMAPTPQEATLSRVLQDFYGAPYKSGGTDPSGVDCSGLIQAVFQRAGVKLPRTVVQQYNTGQPVNLGDLRFGDVVFFNRFCQTKKYDIFVAGILPPAYVQEVCHNGIYIGEGRFVHASPRGVFVSRLDAEVWRASFMGARRYLNPH